MGNKYRLRIRKSGAPAIECAGKVDPDAFRLLRANGEQLLGLPLERISGLSHPTPKVLRVKLIVNERSIGTLELEEAAVGGPFAPLTALYTELVKSLEALKGKRRRQVASMDPIVMSEFLRKAAASFGAKPEPLAFMTAEEAASSSPMKPAGRLKPSSVELGQQPVMLQNAVFEEVGAPEMFDDEESSSSHLRMPAPRPQKEDMDALLKETNGLKGQLSMAQRRLESEASSSSATIHGLEQQVAMLRQELQGQSKKQQAVRQLESVTAERDVAQKTAKAALQERDALRAELLAATGQLSALQEARTSARQAEQQRERWLEQAQASFDRVSAQLKAAVQERDEKAQAASQAAQELAAAQDDTMALSTALDAARDALEDRAAAHKRELADLRLAFDQAETDKATMIDRLQSSEEAIARLEDELDAAKRVSSNAALDMSETHQELSRTQQALRQAQLQVTEAETAQSQGQKELAALQSQLEELKAAVGQAVEEIEMQNEIQAQQQAALQDLTGQIAAKDAQLEALLQSTKDAEQAADSQRVADEEAAGTIAALENQVQQLHSELETAAAARYSMEDRAMQQCPSCLALESRVKEANLRAEAAVGDAMSRIEAAEAELEATNRDLKEATAARNTLVAEKQALIEKMLQQQSARPFEGPNSTRTSQIAWNGQEQSRPHQNFLSEGGKRDIHLQNALQAAENRAAAAENKVRQLELEHRPAQLDSEASAEVQSAFRKVRQLETQLADSEARLAANTVVIEQHRQRREIQERRADGLQARLEALQREAKSRVAEAAQEAQTRMTQQLQGARNAQQHSEAAIAKLQNANAGLSNELSDAKEQAAQWSQELQNTRSKLQAAQKNCQIAQNELTSLRDQAEFDAARCQCLQEEVVRLTRYLQETNADVEHTRALMEEQGIDRGIELDSSLWPHNQERLSLRPQLKGRQSSIAAGRTPRPVDSSAQANKRARIPDSGEEAATPRKSELYTGLPEEAHGRAERSGHHLLASTQAPRRDSTWTESWREIPAAKPAVESRLKHAGAQTPIPTRAQLGSRRSQLGLLSEIQSAGKALQQLSSKLEAVGMASRSRQNSFAAFSAAPTPTKFA